MGLYGPTVLFVVNTLSFLGVLVAAASTRLPPPHDGARPWRRADPQAAAYVLTSRARCA